MAKNNTIAFSLMMIVMALFLQSQSGGCCNTPQTPQNTPTAEGILYLPKMQAPVNSPLGEYIAFPNATCNGIPVFLLTLPDGTQIYPTQVSNATLTDFYFKVRITSSDGCYQQNVFVNPTNRTALGGVGNNGIKVRYPTGKPYVVEVWAQLCVCVTCNANYTGGLRPEWYCKFANDNNDPFLFGTSAIAGNPPGNPANITLHQQVVSNIIFSFNYNGNGNGSIEAKFKYNGIYPFGQNVL